MFNIGICVTSCGRDNCGIFSPTLCPICVQNTLKANGLGLEYTDRIKDLDHRGHGRISGCDVSDEIRAILRGLDKLWELSGKLAV